MVTQHSELTCGAIPMTSESISEEAHHHLETHTFRVRALVVFPATQSKRTHASASADRGEPCAQPNNMRLKHVSSLISRLMRRIMVASPWKMESKSRES